MRLKRKAQRKERDVIEEQMLANRLHAFNRTKTNSKRNKPVYLADFILIRS